LLKDGLAWFCLFLGIQPGRLAFDPSFASELPPMKTPSFFRKKDAYGFLRTRGHFAAGYLAATGRSAQ
jgi:hypothetical protein